MDTDVNTGTIGGQRREHMKYGQRCGHRDCWPTEMWTQKLRTEVWTQELQTEVWTQELRTVSGVDTGTTDSGVDTGTTDADVDTGTTYTHEQPVKNLFCATVTPISNDPCCHKVN